MTDALVPTATAERIRIELEAAIAPHLAAKQALYAQAATYSETVKVDSSESLVSADDLLKEILREKDALEAVRKSGPGALDRIVRAINARFKPLRDLLEKAEANLRVEIGGYVQRQRAAQEAAYQAAAASHAAGEHAAAQVALVAASEAATVAPEGTTVKEVWAVARIDRGFMTDEWLIPDMARIEKLARETPAGVRPIVPGVVFELVARVIARR